MTLPPRKPHASRAINACVLGLIAILAAGCWPFSSKEQPPQAAKSSDTIRITKEQEYRIPFAVCGEILGLYVGGLNFSVSAAVGFISLFGVSAMDGILLVSYIRRAMDEGAGMQEAITGSAEARMRQIFMTALSACIGLVPAAISTGIGSQVQQPLACVIVGGMLLSPICSLLMVPTLARLFMPAIPRGGRTRVSPSHEQTQA